MRSTKHVSISGETYAKLRAYAKAKNLKISEIVTALIDQAVQNG